MINEDRKTAQAFASSWNNLDLGSIYTFEQFLDWINPLEEKDITGKKVLELGCGNASLMVHCAQLKPEKITGVDLGDSVIAAEMNLKHFSASGWELIQDDLINYYNEAGYDIVYCIGVLHHLKKPFEGLRSVVKNTKNGGRFHCWVYAKEGNAIIIYIVDPIRKLASKLPWWVNKYLIATPLIIPYFFYAKALYFFKMLGVTLSFLPLYEYSLWIAKREFYFFRHVAFDQLVTPQTQYISNEEIQKWLLEIPDIHSTYIIMRNGNSWKFGGKKKVR
jgi:SAM-dependent methyltransferase